MSWITRLRSARLCSNQPFAVVFVADADRAENLANISVKLEFHWKGAFYSPQTTRDKKCIRLICCMITYSHFMLYNLSLPLEIQNSAWVLARKVDTNTNCVVSSHRFSHSCVQTIRYISDHI